MAFVGLSTSKQNQEQQSGGNPSLEEKGYGDAFDRPRSRQPRSGEAYDSPAILLLASGLLLISGAVLVYSFALSIPVLVVLAGLVVSGLGLGSLASERRLARRRRLESANTSEKIETLATRLDEGLESLRDVQWEMRDSELRYRDLLDNQADMIMRRDREGRISFVNDAFCQIFGVDQNDMIGAKFLPKLVDGATMPPFDHFADDDRSNYELQLMTGQGPRWFSLEDVAIYDEDGDMREVHTVGRDVTEEKRSASELAEARDLAEEANRAKTRFLATMSHEIRTPMNGIMGMTDLLTESNLSPEQRTYCRAISKSATTLLSLIDEILDFSKIEAGKFEFTNKPYAITEFAEGLVELMAPRAYEKNLSLGCFVSPDLPQQVIGDETRMRQIVLNLIGNAIKFTDLGGVMLEITQSEGKLRFAVSDTGIGLDSDQLERIFVEFEQVDSSNARRNGGTGLGLAISRRLVEKMDGEIKVSSVRGKGSAFTVDMPLESPAGVSKLRDGLIPPLDVKRVMVACDHELEGRLIGNMLKSIGIEVAVMDRRMALERLEDKMGQPFDTLITDAVEAPKLAENLLRAAEKHKDGAVKALMLIEATDRRDYEPLRGKGFGAYVTRPVRHLSLLAQLDKVQARSVLPKPEADMPGFEPRTLSFPGSAPRPIAPFARTVAEQPAKPEAPMPRAPALPDHSAEQIETTPARRETAPRSGHARARILLAEDNEINALLGGRLLEHMGYEVVHVTDGVQAVNTVKKSYGGTAYDAILMDIHMPHMDGIRATREIRAYESLMDPMGHQIPIIALTANAFDEVKTECYSVGMNAYLAKPFAREELKEIIEGCLTRQAEMAS